jgi:hypothetical protein
MEEMLHILDTTYIYPLAALEVATAIRDYAEAALTTAAFTEHTSITIEDDPVHVSNARAPSPYIPDTSARHLPPCRLHSGIIPRRQCTPRPRPLLSALATGSPDIDPPPPRSTPKCSQYYDVPKDDLELR